MSSIWGDVKRGRKSMKRMLCLILVAFALCACDNRNWGALSLRNTEEKLEVMDAEEALPLLFWSSDDVQNWKMLHKQEVPTEYYRFTGSFVVEGADDVDGTLTALIVAGENGIISVLGIMLKTECADVQLETLDRYYVIGVNGNARSVRVAADFYLRTGNLQSNTLHPAFTVTLP